MSDWLHFALLSHLTTEKPIQDTRKLARIFGVKSQDVECALERLLRLGQIAVNPGGSLVRTNTKISSSDGRNNIAVQKAHAETLEIANEVLQSVPLEQRDFTFLTLAIDPKNLIRAKKRIRRFHNEMSDLLQSGKKTAVYRLGIQLYPLRNGNRKIEIDGSGE